jgi:hypothetical protein
MFHRIASYFKQFHRHTHAQALQSLAALAAEKQMISLIGWPGFDVLSTRFRVVFHGEKIVR